MVLDPAQADGSVRVRFVKLQEKRARGRAQQVVHHTAPSLVLLRDVCRPVIDGIAQRHAGVLDDTVRAIGLRREPEGVDNEVCKGGGRKRANAVTLGDCPLHRLHQFRVVAAGGAVVLLEDRGGAVAVEQEVSAVRDRVDAALQLQQKFRVLGLMPQVHENRIGPHCPRGRLCSGASAPHLGRGLRGRANWGEGWLVRETPHAVLGDAGGGRPAAGPGVRGRDGAPSRRPPGRAPTRKP